MVSGAFKPFCKSEKTGWQLLFFCDATCYLFLGFFFPPVKQPPDTCKGIGKKRKKDATYGMASTSSTVHFTFAALKNTGIAI